MNSLNRACKNLSILLIIMLGVIMLGGMCSAIASAPGVDPDMQVYYKFDNNLSNVFDSSLNQINGTKISGANLIYKSNCLPLNTGCYYSSGSGYINVSQAVRAKMGGGYTMNAWVNISTINTDTNPRQIISFTNRTGSTFYSEIVARNNSGNSRIYFRLQYNATNCDYAASYTLNSGVYNKFMMITGVYDGLYKILYLYIDGKLMGYSTISAGCYNILDLNTPTKQLKIGGNNFNGMIDEAIFYNRSLNTSEIRKLYSDYVNKDLNKNIIIKNNLSIEYDNDISSINRLYYSNTYGAIKIPYRDGFNFTFGEKIFENRQFINIPTYDGSNNSLHPSLYYNSTGFNGWKYWLAFTPYYNQNSTFENPSIAVSNDSINWIIPSGLVNPIINRTYFCNGTISPINPDYGCEGTNLADPSLIYDNGLLRLYFVYELGGSISTNINRTSINPYYEQIWEINSTNGIDWSSPIIVMNKTVNIRNYSGVIREDFQMMSPSIVKVEGMYYLWITNLYGDSSIGERHITELYNSTDGITFNFVSNTTINGNDNIMVWHPDIKYISSLNQFWMFYAGESNYYYNPNPKIGKSLNLYFANSSDGINWYTPNNNSLSFLSGNRESLDGYRLYKPAWIVNETDYNITMIYSTRSTTNVTWVNWLSYGSLNQILNNKISTGGITISLWTKDVNGSTKYFGTPYSFVTSKYTLFKSGSELYGGLYGNEYIINRSINRTWNNIILNIGDSDVKVYYNGVLSLIFPTENRINNTYTEIGDNNFYIGGVDIYRNYGFNKSLTEFRMYNRSLEHNEILNIYNSGITSNASINSSELISWLPLNGSINDLSLISSTPEIINDVSWSFDESSIGLLNKGVLDNINTTIANVTSIKNGTLISNTTITNINGTLGIPAGGQIYVS